MLNLSAWFSRWTAVENLYFPVGTTPFLSDPKISFISITWPPALLLGNTSDATKVHDPTSKPGVQPLRVTGEIRYSQTLILTGAHPQRYYLIVIHAETHIYRSHGVLSYTSIWRQEWTLCKFVWRGSVYFPAMHQRADWAWLTGQVRCGYKALGVIKHTLRVWELICCQILHLRAGGLKGLKEAGGAGGRRV